MGRYSVVGIATCYGLDGPGIESRWGARFSPPIQTDPWGSPPVKWLPGLPGVKMPWRGIDHLSPSRVEVKERVDINLFSRLGLHGMFQGELYLCMFKLYFIY